jgi:uncharacterized FlaG/YvyC family protein
MDHQKKASRYIPKTLQQKSAEKIAKLEKEGRYFDGKYYSKAGTAVVLGYWDGDKFIEPEGGHKVYVEAREIDEKRLVQFQDLWESLIRSHFPARYCWGAMWDHDDLLAQCQIETFKALSETFDPSEIRSGVEKCKTAAQRMKRYQDEKESCRDFEKLLYIAERGWVKGRLEGFLRRCQYNFHPQQLGGATQSLTPLSEESSQNTEMKQNLFYETTVVSDEAREKTEELLTAMERLGQAEARNMFFSMSRNVQEEVLQVIDSRRDRTMDRALEEGALLEALDTRVAGFEYTISGGSTEQHPPA